MLENNVPMRYDCRSTHPTRGWYFISWQIPFVRSDRHLTIIPIHSFNPA